MPCAPTDRPPFDGIGLGDHRFLGGAVAELVFLAAAAIAVVVRADLLLLAGRARRTASSRLVVMFSSVKRVRTGCSRHDRLDAEDRMDKIVLDVLLQPAEHLVPFGLVHDEGIALTVRLEPDAFAQIVHRGQMLDPEPVDHRQQDVPFDLAHRSGAEPVLDFAG